MFGIAAQLTIALSGENVVVSWPANTLSSYAFEATNALDSTTIGAASWPNAGTPSVVGLTYVVTNTFSVGNRFYRLRPP